MVLKEVTMINFTSLYMCVSIVRESLFTTAYLQLLQSPTLYWVSTNPG